MRSRSRSSALRRRTGWRDSCDSMRRPMPPNRCGDPVSFRSAVPASSRSRPSPGIPPVSPSSSIARSVCHEPALDPWPVQHRVPGHPRLRRGGDACRARRRPRRSSRRARARLLTIHRRSLQTMKPIDWWRRFRVPLLWAGALGFGLLGASGARSYIAGELDAARQRADMSGQLVEVVVAKRGLAPGDRIDAESMAVRKVPATYLPAGAVTPAEFPAYEGEALQLAMVSGEPLFAAAVSARERRGLSSRIPPGTRAMTVMVDEVNSVSGMLRPGDRIDLMFSVRPRPDAGLPVGEVATPLMSNLLVLATGTRTQVEPAPDAVGRF